MNLTNQQLRDLSRCITLARDWSGAMEPGSRTQHELFRAVKSARKAPSRDHQVPKGDKEVRYSQARQAFQHRRASHARDTRSQRRMKLKALVYQRNNGSKIEVHQHDHGFHFHVNQTDGSTERSKPMSLQTACLELAKMQAEDHSTVVPADQIAPAYRSDLQRLMP